MMLLHVLMSVFFVAFSDKNGSEHIALSEEAMSLRQAHDIAIDSLDYAVSAAYIDSLRAAGAKVLHASRWMNGATIEADSAVIERIEQYPFVAFTECTRDEHAPSRAHLLRHKPAKTALATDYGYARQQLELYNLTSLHRAGYKGQGMRIAVIDGGFENANTLQALDAVRTQILGHYDFTDDPYDFFGSHGEHGTMCLSTIAATRPDYCGAATGASYYLMRTEEYDTESPKEIDNWVAAIEAADSIGVHITSTSLGYSTFDNPAFDLMHRDIDGRSTRGSRAATIAARKGMLVVVAAGNEGQRGWQRITVPADADSILAVGATNVEGDIAAFSSSGPSSDGRVKPDVCAAGWGTALINPADNQVVLSNGTSFACPLIAGMAACVWSALPEEGAMQIRDRIIRSAHKYDNPDTRYGYGIPDAWAAIQNTGDMAVWATDNTASQPQKWLIDGKIVIIRNGQCYDVQGRKIATINQ